MDNLKAEMQRIDRQGYHANDRLLRKNRKEQNQWRNRFYISGSGRSAQQTFSGDADGVSVSPAGQERMKKSPGKGREVKTMPFLLGAIILGASALGVVIAVVGLFRLQLEICLIGQLISTSAAVASLTWMLIEQLR